MWDDIYKQIIYMYIYILFIYMNMIVIIEIDELLNIFFDCIIQY